jgi:hypothetical protein
MPVPRISRLDGTGACDNTAAAATPMITIISRLLNSRDGDIRYSPAEQPHATPPTADITCMPVHHLRVCGASVMRVRS